MQCENCGSELVLNKKFCLVCGKKTRKNKTKTHIPHDKVGRLTFLNKYALKKSMRNILAVSIALYIASFLNLIFVLNTGKYFLIDSLIFLLFGLLIHIFQSRVIAIILTIYVSFSTLAGFYLNGRTFGFLILIIAIAGIKGTIKFNKLWKEYKYNPEEYINKYENSNFGGRKTI